MENLEPQELAARLAAFSPAKRALFEQKLRQVRRGHGGALEIPRRVERADAPLSFAQQRLWFLNQLEPNSSNYNEPNALRLSGPLDVQALGAAFEHLVARHEILRSTIVPIDGEPRQVIAPTCTAALDVIDLRATTRDGRDAAVEGAAHAAMARPFTLSSDPPIRLTLIQVDDRESIVLLVMHHSASDGGSTPILWRELAALYSACRAGVAPGLPDVPIQYQDYAAWQRHVCQGAALDAQLAYWTKELERATPLDLPIDRKRVEGRRSPARSVVLDLDQDLATALKALGRRHEVTLFIVLLAAFETLLHRSCGQDDIVVGSPIAGRTRPELERLVGCFVNTLVLRLDFSDDPTFERVLRQAREVSLAAYANQDVPFERIVEALNPTRDAETLPLLRVLFAVQAAPTGVEFPSLHVSPVELPSLEAKADLFLAVLEQDAGLQLRAEFATDLFDVASIDRMLAHFAILLGGVTSCPQCRVSDLPLMTDAERRRLLVEWNRTARPYPRDACVHELFELQAQRTPAAVAVIAADRRLTYRDLDERANRLGHFLRSRGVGRGTPVAVCLTRSTNLIVALLAVLKAGGAYVPLDPDYPDDRLRFMVDDTRARVLLTEEPLLAHLSVARTPTLFSTIACLDRDGAAIASESSASVPSITEAADLAYVMYTSGSTGRAKGVEVVHRGITRLLFGGGYAQLEGGQTILHAAPATFDASTLEIWGALLHGGTCIVCPERVPSAQLLGDLLRAHEVSTLWLSAAFYNAVIDDAPDILRGVKQLLIGGEALSVAHVRRGLDLLPTTEIINGYGPTESTTFACCYRIPRPLEATLGSIPIGRPIGNTSVYVLDRHLKPVPIGVAGELYIGGDGLARGYLNDTALTAAKFVQNPFAADAPDASERLYRTGDIVRYLASGDIDFVGRNDDQVKIRGHRVEPGEISSVLREHPAVQDAVVVIHEGQSGDKRLAAYVVYTAGTDAATVDANAFLRRRLPEYLMPSTITALPALPLNANGKLDRRALPAPDLSLVARAPGHQQPRTATEVALVGIWADVLRAETVGVHDNFFDLGGHSLLVVRLFARIKRALGKDLPLTTLFRAPTVAQLAAVLDRPDPAATDSCVVPVHTGGTRPPFFWIHGDGSDALLPRYLGPDQPLYCFDHQSQDGKPAQRMSVEAVAAYYLGEIKQLCDRGPYYLGGYSFGGLVAFEVARQLHARGEHVALLALLDPAAPTGEATSRPLDVGRFWKRRDVAKHVRAKIDLGLKRAVVKTCLTLGRELPQWVRIQYIVDIYRLATARYSMQPYSGRTLLFKGEGRSSGVWPQWQTALKGETQISTVIGDHDDLRQESSVRVWATHLAASLQAAQSVNHR